MTRRLAAAGALVLQLGALVLAVVVMVENFPNGVAVLVCVALAVLVGWWGLLREGIPRLVGLGLAGLLLAGAVALVIFEGRPLDNLIVLVALLLALPLGRYAFAPHVRLPEAPRPKRPVLFFNPKSGGGKAERFHVADEARARGIEPIELRRGQDLHVLVRDAIARGADGLAMAGGDGSQAIVAAEAAETGLPYACIPSGTRNHFALDLGVNRDDVVGALDAFVNGGERLVDLAEVNGRVFVNNVSLGIYAEAVQSAGYRDAKIRTLLDTVPQVLGPGQDGLDLGWTGPDGKERRSAAVVLVSNDPYRLGRALGSGTRPRLDRGVLGIATVGAGSDAGKQEGISEWASATFEVRSENPVAAGIDGEAVKLDPPLRFRTKPAALRVRIAPHHPGASPSALTPATPWGAMAGLARIAVGRHPSG